MEVSVTWICGDNGVVGVVEGEDHAGVTVGQRLGDASIRGRYVAFRRRDALKNNTSFIHGSRGCLGQVARDCPVLMARARLKMKIAS